MHSQTILPTFVRHSHECRTNFARRSCECRMAVANQSHEYFATQLRIFARIYRAASRSHIILSICQRTWRICKKISRSWSMMALDLMKSMHAKMIKVAAYLLAATSVKQARNKRLRNDRRKKTLWVMEWLLSRDVCANVVRMSQCSLS